MTLSVSRIQVYSTDDRIVDECGAYGGMSIWRKS
jgi:hypothetical protein